MANMTMCPNGHYYDGDRYSECPYCKPGSNAAGFSAGPSDMGSTMPLNQDRGGRPSPDMEKTVRMVVQETGIDPVVGWLVCTAGKDKGKDFRLHTGNNFVGRSPDMDVTLTDPSVSASNHFGISYDQRHERYFISMGTGKELVYVNGDPLPSGSRDLVKWDMIEVAGTTLMFIPLCGSTFSWGAK